MDDNIPDRIATAQTCYFISPHYDDMVLSAGGLATELAKTHKIVVINIFTAGGATQTLSAKSYLKQCGYNDPAHLYHDRQAEDARALRGLADEVINLGFTEALWRKKAGPIANKFGRLLPEFAAVYPTYRWHLTRGKAAKADAVLIRTLSEKLAAIIPDKDAVVFCPAGIGKHVDHVITNIVCTSLFTRPVYWADYPYMLTDTSKPTVAAQPFLFAKHGAEKCRRIRSYTSQYKAMFGSQDLVLPPEQYYFT